MKITAAKVIVTCPGRNFVTLKIETDQGVYGLGDATLNGRELAVVSYLKTMSSRCLIGRDPRRIEDIWQYLYRGAYWRRGPVTMRAIAAVDVALWDIKAKMAGMPLYQLLGGASRERRDGLRPRQRRRHRRDGRGGRRTTSTMGYKAIRAQTGVPGIKDAYGVGRGKLSLRAGRRRAADRARSGTPRKYLRLRARSCSRSCAQRSASTSTCCTTATTG